MNETHTQLNDTHTQMNETHTQTNETRDSFVCVCIMKSSDSHKIKSYVSYAEYSLFYRALLQKRPIILSILLVAATPYETDIRQTERKRDRDKKRERERGRVCVCVCVYFVLSVRI